MTEQTILRISGVVRRAGEPVEGAYIDLVDDDGTFIAERRTGPDGTYSFHITGGKWTLVCRAAGASPVQRPVSSGPGEAEVVFELA